MANFILLMSDEHNPKYSSVYGHPFVRTPNMERLAAAGTVYENAYCGSPLCVPNRSSFMTGRYVHDIEMFNNCKVIEGRYPSYGGVLAEQGVHTAYVGSAANLYRDPFDLGFTEMRLVNKTKKRLAKDFIRSPVPKREGGVYRAGYGPKEDAWASDAVYVDEAVRWLHETAPTITEPWVLIVNVHAPHPPLHARPDLWEMYDGYGDLPTYRGDQPSANHPYAMDLRQYQNTHLLDDERIKGLRQGYYALVTHVDEQLGKLVDTWEQLNMQTDTVLAYTTDHGEMLGKFDIWWKSSMYEDSIRIPVLAAGPGFAAGQRVSTPVASLDVQAAMFHATGKKRPANWAGEPLQTLPAADSQRVVFSEYHAHGVRSGAFAVRRGDWKLIYNMAAPHQLFNLATDPDELHNVWEAQPDIAADLENELRQICDPERVNDRAHEKEREQLAIIDSMLADPNVETLREWD